MKKGLCRRLKLHALSSCVSKKRKSKCRSEVAGAKTTSGYGYRTTSPLQVAIVDNSVAPFIVVPENSITRDSDISHIAPLGSNKKGGSKLSPAKFVGRGATVAPGSLLHCGRSGNASSEHLYSDALYNVSHRKQLQSYFSKFFYFVIVKNHRDLNSQYQYVCFKFFFVSWNINVTPRTHFH